MVRRDRWRAKALLGTLAVSITLTLLALNYSPSLGDRLARPVGLPELSSYQRHISVFGDISIDLTGVTEDVLVRRIVVRATALTGDVHLHLPPGAELVGREQRRAPGRLEGIKVELDVATPLGRLIVFE